MEEISVKQSVVLPFDHAFVSQVISFIPHILFLHSTNSSCCYAVMNSR